MISEDWKKNGEDLATGQTLSSKFNLTGRWFFWAFLVVAVAGLTVAGFYFYQYKSASGVELLLEAPQETMAGVPFEIKISVQNNSDKAIEGASLSMVLPENSAFVSNSSQNVLNKDIGNLEQGETYQDKVSVVVFGTKNMVQKFDASAYYYPPALGSKARFEKTNSVSVSVREPAIKLDLSAPQKILNNEEFEITASYQNVSPSDFPLMRLKASYPGSFAFKQSDPSPDFGNNVWEAKKLSANSENAAVKIKGSALGPENSFFEIKISAFAELNGKEYLVNEKTASLNIAQSPLSLVISANDNPDYYASLGSNITYKAFYRNNSDTGLNDAVIKLQLSGEMFDFASLSSKGSFNSQTNTLTFNASSIPELRAVSPGASGQVEFYVRTKSFYPIRRVSDKDYTLKVKGEISSPTVPYYVASDKTITLAELETKVGGKVVVDSQAFFRDSASGIFNSGSLPPKVNNPVQFTIHWIITNHSTDIKNVQIKSFLGAGVKWTNAVKSNITSVPTYNENTQEVNWLIDQIPATKGITGNPIEAVFQVEAAPSVTQIGLPMTLLGETFLSAIDQFVNANLAVSDDALTTRLPDDPTVGQSQGTVVQ
jgi:hypothetical protein